MSIDKWLDGKNSKEEKLRRDKAFKQLSKEEVEGLKKKKIREIVKKQEEDKSDHEREKLLQQIIEFKEWLEQRTYLKGDLDKLVMWIKNLNSIISLSAERRERATLYDEKKKIIEKYKEIPPKFLDEKIRIAINKLISGTQRTSSDNYYIRKLKNMLKEKLKEAEYYDILDKLFKIF